MRNKDRSEGKEEAEATSASSIPVVRREPELPVHALSLARLRIHLDKVFFKDTQNITEM